MDNTTGFFCKVAAVALSILAVIVGIVVGFRVGSLVTALLWWGVGLFLGMLLYGLGEILCFLEHLASRVEWITISLRDAGVLGKQDAPTKDGWTCSKCGAVNPPFMVDCKECSANKFSE